MITPAELTRIHELDRRLSHTKGVCENVRAITDHLRAVDQTLGSCQRTIKMLLAERVELQQCIRRLKRALSKKNRAKEVL